LGGYTLKPRAEIEPLGNPVPGRLSQYFGWLFWATVGEKIGVIVILGVKTAKLVGGHRAASIL